MLMHMEKQINELVRLYELAEREKKLAALEERNKALADENKKLVRKVSSLERCLSKAATRDPLEGKACKTDVT